MFRGRTPICVFLLWGLLKIAVSHAAGATLTSELAELDARQKVMVATADVEGLAKLAHPNLLINAPTNRILTREQFLAMMRSGQIGAEAFERTAESVTVTGKIGVVMGFEVFTPMAASELGKTFGVRPLKRRYTNVYVKENGKWLWLARHANVVPEQSKLAS